MPFLYSDIAYLMYVTVNLKLDKYIIEKYQKKHAFLVSETREN